jgi:prepilin peptidase CpaA
MMVALASLSYWVLIAFAAAHDVRTMTIPNWVSVAIVLTFFPAAILAGMDAGDIGAHLAAGAIALLVCAGLFYLNVFGGGDAKVIAASFVWTGFAGAPDFIFGTALAGGVLALGLVIARRMRVSSPSPWAQRLLSPQEGAPYAVAIAFGALFAAGSAPLMSAGLRPLGLL